MRCSACCGKEKIITAKKILVVDDEPDILSVIAFRLKKSGYEIVTAGDGKETLDLMQNWKPDLILLDIQLPVMDGYEVCRRIKADEELKHIPIVFFAASNGSSIVKKIKEVRADDYLIKPFDPEELLRKIQKFIG